jgi:hypothetical protein
MAAAASFRPGALPAVIAPSGRNAGFNRASASIVVVGTVGFVLIEWRRPLPAGNLDRRDL